MADYMTDLDEVTRLIGLYIDGANGDVAKLKEAFHPDARMMGHIGPMETYIPIQDFFEMIEAQPGGAGPNYKATIRTIDLVGDAGVAVLVETDFIGCDFVDYFSVARIEGRWQITNKTYAHTGGQPPGAAES
ncbi:MAG: nuclear transport factor 2 family protein [Ilumatobacteraceae bacterium]